MLPAVAPVLPAALTPWGLRITDPALDSYPVRVGGATAVVVLAGDEVSVVDPDGGQLGEVTLLCASEAATASRGATASARDPFSALGLRPDAPATVLRGLVAEDPILAPLCRRGLIPAEATCHPVHGAGSLPGDRVTWWVQEPATVVVAAPAGRVVDGAAPASELRLDIRRASPRAASERALPPPLAEPRLDVRVDRATALAYEVRAGEWIQIIDVAGQQCSDLLAFDLAKLERGLERGIDPTTTRTLLGRAHPAPGRQRRLFDTDMDPLLEVVRDTVGRHDAYGLACTRKYYEDAGYPGHVNCSDNFNRQLHPWRVSPREGWEALNLFYNTAYDHEQLLVTDEPWSRPGDHVLLRAATDLLCASSACPDDIDPANAWECTDIHLRVYPAKERFSMAIAHRHTVDAEPVMTRPSGFAPRTEALTDRFTDVHGTWIPTGFHGGGALDEYRAVRERVGVMDLSSLRKWEVLGPGAVPLLQRLTTRDVRAMAVGQVTYTALCHETGGMVDDGTLLRLGDDRFRYVGNDPADGDWLRRHAAAVPEKVLVKDVTGELDNLAVQGPRSREVLAGLVWTAAGETPLDELRWFRGLVGRIGGPKGTPVVVTRTGYTGELGYEVFCHPSDAVAVWDAVLEAGGPSGIAPVGFDALDLLRIEAGLILSGHEFDDETDPFEAGIGFAVALDQPEPFLGDEALRQRAEHPRHALVGLLLDGEEPVGHGAAIYAGSGRQRVGVVTSGCVSPHLSGPIALARVATQHAPPGSRLEVGMLDGHLKRIGATVTSIPFYDPQKTRPRA